MAYSKANDPKSSKSIQDLVNIIKELIGMAQEKKQFEDGTDKECDDKDKDHEKAIAFVWMASDFVKEEESTKNGERK